MAERPTGTGTELPAFAEPLFGNSAEEARPHLDSAGFDAAWELGQSMSYAELVDYANTL